METKLSGIHHITVLASDPKRNLAFYTQVLGQRLVKRTVNFDDPFTYHFYFGDAIGTPGTLITFFPFVNAKRGQVGSGEISRLAYAIPAGQMGYWQDRLQTRQIPFTLNTHPLDGQVLTLRDPDGLQIDLLETSQPPLPAIHWAESDVPAQSALSGFLGVSFAANQMAHSIQLLNETFGLALQNETANTQRLTLPNGSWVEVVKTSAGRGFSGAGTVHHIAWRTANDQTQQAWREHLMGLGLHVTPMQDRNYFHSIYFREPSGVLYEIATDPPGFAIDETPQQLGSALQLPARYAPYRDEITANLPSLD
ncbi:MAG TPA: VOC family protein [Anaerolineales bacterium]|nr:VOC family protein [Anaerolineales bacterium]